MKKVLLFTLSIFITAGLMAQCSDLFISEYVEGSNNNRALEIYNPTANPINLSDYNIARFRNGAIDFSSTNGEPVALPNIMLQPYDAYVVVLDRRQEDGVGFDHPVWNGYNVFETGVDDLGEIIIDFCRDAPRQLVQYVDDDSAKPFEYEETYKPEYDLQGKADVFISPDYDTNNHMSFNGDDAMALMMGTTIANDGSNIIDVIGVIGEDPGEAWVDANNKWITRNITIVRHGGVQAGAGAVIDTMAYSEWDYYCQDDFTKLGSHDCNCDPNYVGVQEVVNEIPVSVQPNPATDWLLVNAAERIQQIEVYDLTGKQIFLQNYDGFDNEIHLSVSQFNSGIYMVNVIFDDNKRTVEKFIIK